MGAAIQALDQAAIDRLTQEWQAALEDVARRIDAALAEQARVTGALYRDHTSEAMRAELAEREAQIAALREALEHFGDHEGAGCRTLPENMCAIIVAYVDDRDWHKVECTCGFGQALANTADAARAFVERIQAQVIKEERGHYIPLIDALGEVLTVASGIPEAVRANALAVLETVAQHAGTGFAQELAPHSFVEHIQQEAAEEMRERCIACVYLLPEYFDDAEDVAMFADELRALPPRRGT